MNNYSSLAHAIDDLRTRGYDVDFDLGKKNFGVQTEDTNVIGSGDFRVDEVYMFRGNTAPCHSSILFAITASKGVRGILIDEYAINQVRRQICYPNKQMEF